MIPSYPQVPWVDTPRKLSSGDDLFEFKKPLPKRTALRLSSGLFIAFFALWCLLSYGAFISPIFLPTPTQVAMELVELFTQKDFHLDIATSVQRVLGGFALAAALAVPLGILMGSFRPFDALISPFSAFIRFMPAAAFIPLIILWVGIDYSQKVAVIFMGVFFYMLNMIAERVAEVPKDLIETAYSLGATRTQILFRVITPASVPGILESLRTMVGAAWTYLVVAELVAAETGIGYRIIEAQRYLQTDRVIAGILVIGAIGLLTDLLFRLLIRLATPWKE